MRHGWGRIKDIAEYCCVSERTVWNWIHRGQLPYSKIGKCALVKYADADSLLENHRQTPRQEADRIVDEVMRNL